MIEILQYAFMQRAFVAGVIIGLISPLIGVFLVVRRMSMIADALAHVTLSGVAAGLLLQKEFSFFAGMNPLYMGMTFSVMGSLFVERVRKLYKTYQELAIPIILSSGIGLGVVLISAADGFNVDVASYLFGNILTVSRGELWWVIGVGLLVISVVLLFYKEFFSLSFDEENAVLSGIPHRWLHLLFIVLVALVITASIRVVGILLVSGLMTLPVAASLQVARSFRQTLWLAILFGQIAVLSGLVVAYYLNWASGGTIVLVSVLILLIVVGIRYFRRMWLKQTEIRTGQ